MTSHWNGSGVLVVLGLLLAVASTAQAQAPAAMPAPRFTLWMGAGYGRGIAEQFEGAEEAFTVNVSAQKGHLLLSGRVAAVSSSIFDTSWDLGLLAGVASSPRHPIHVGAGLGLGYAEPTTGKGVFTVPAELQVFWRAAAFVGVGLYGFATINNTDSFGGATLALQLGRLR
jgi:hypothetical protein